MVKSDTRTRKCSLTLIYTSPTSNSNVKLVSSQLKVLVHMNSSFFTEERDVKDMDIKELCNDV
jgi:hypothetical protein